MSSFGSNRSNGSQDPKSVSVIQPDDPFARGVWLMTMVGGRDLLVQIEGTEKLSPAERDIALRDMRDEMVEHRSLCVRFSRKYIFQQLQFPARATDVRGNATGPIQPASLATVGKHEASLELLEEFTTTACLLSVTFIDEFSAGDLNRLRMSVRNADEAIDNMKRMERSNLISPTTVSVR